VTVRAHDFAQSQFCLDFEPTSIPQRSGDGEVLLPEVIALENHRVVFAAVDARIALEKRDELRDVLFRQPVLPKHRFGDVALLVGGVVLLLVRSATWAAVSVALALVFASPCELFERFRLATPAAAFHVPILSEKSNMCSISTIGGVCSSPQSSGFRIAADLTISF
jgi:hypothetical protein